MKKFLFALISLSLLLTACEKKSSRDRDNDDDDDNTPTNTIPSDAAATPPPTIDHNNLNIPNAIFYVSNASSNIVSINMSGILDPNTSDFIDLSGTATQAQTIWLQVDGIDKGILVRSASTKAADKSSTPLQADVIFLVDNSGSMGEEADTIASQIIAFASYLNVTLNLQVGCVGYNDYGNISGAKGMGTSEDLRYYLNDRVTYGGTSRTKGFEQTIEGDSLESAAYSYASPLSGENGMAALRFADEHFIFRPTANRIYINFTDEPNQTDYVGSPWSVESLNPDSTSFLDWNVNQGTVHSVFSEDTTDWYYYNLDDEKPWLMAEYTGGTSLFILSDATDLDLTSLPVTGALAQSSEILFVNNSTVANGQHSVTIHVESANGASDGRRTYNNVTFGSGN